VPKLVKQTITTMQITQFLVGATFAMAHLFVSYTIPVSVPYTYSFADLTSGLASEISSAASVATASASADLGSWLKKIAFRAAGEEGLAENVRNEQGKAFGIDAIHAAKDLKMREEIRYRDELRMIHCTDTSGQVFAILINCFYLAPLTWLFVRFFIRSYLKRGENQQRKSSTMHQIEESGKDAVKDAKRELDQALDENPGSMEVENDSSRSQHSETSKPDFSEKESGDPKKQNGKQGSESASAEDSGAKTDGKEPNEDAEKDDVEILDSAAAVKDVLDADTETAGQFSKDLENSKAG
jgi:GNS1/SUR4 family